MTIWIVMNCIILKETFPKPLHKEGEKHIQTQLFSLYSTIQGKIQKCEKQSTVFRIFEFWPGEFNAW